LRKLIERYLKKITENLKEMELFRYNSTMGKKLLTKDINKVT